MGDRFLDRFRRGDLMGVEVVFLVVVKYFFCCLLK